MGLVVSPAKGLHEALPAKMSLRREQCLAAIGMKPETMKIAETRKMFFVYLSRVELYWLLSSD
jgi:carbamoylphosphate synthase large subunit